MDPKNQLFEKIVESISSAQGLNLKGHDGKGTFIVGFSDRGRELSGVANLEGVINKAFPQATYVRDARAYKLTQDNKNYFLSTHSNPYSISLIEVSR